jgi:predicted GNAT family N-acyltransferase
LAITVFLVKTEEDFQHCLAVREEVFLVEQAVAREVERDGLDEQCIHVLARDEEQVVGCGRLRMLEEGLAKVERVAVRKAWRTQGVGRLLMEALHREARRRKFEKIVLGSQLTAELFYIKQGYEAVNDEIFLEAGIQHRMMSKRL